MRPKKDATKAGIPRGNYSNLHQLEKEKGWTRIWDKETQNPWLIAPDHKVVVGYDDAESVAIKTEWAMKQGFRGVFFWQIGADLLPDNTNPLQEASRKKLGTNAEKGGETAERTERYRLHSRWPAARPRAQGRPDNAHCRPASPARSRAPG